MKRYKTNHFDGNKSKPSFHIAEISKQGKLDGALISFSKNGAKNWQYKFKNDFLNGSCKDWWYNKAIFFSNFKKNILHGIKITLK